MPDIELLDVYGDVPSTAAIKPKSDRIVIMQDGALKYITPDTLLSPSPTLDISSAATIDLTDKEGNTAHITGNEPITDILIDEKAQPFWLIFDDDGGTLSNVSTIDVPGKEIVWGAGDKAEIIGLAGGLSQVRQFVRKSGSAARPGIFHCTCVSAANVDISTLNDGDTVNGTVVATDDVVLLAFQTAGAENGLYVVGATAGTTVRHNLFDTYDSFFGVTFIIDSAPTNDDAPQIWACSSSPGGVLDTDDIDFEFLTARIRQAWTEAIAGTFAWFKFRMIPASSVDAVTVHINDVVTAARQFIWKLNDGTRTLDMAGDLTVAGDASVSGDLTDTRPVVAKVDTDSPYAVDAAETGTIFTNEGTAGDVIFELPASAGCTAGKTRFTFANLDTSTTYKNKIKPDGTDHLYFIAAAAAYDAVNASPARDGAVPGSTITIYYAGGGIWLTEGAPTDDWAI